MLAEDDVGPRPSPENLANAAVTLNKIFNDENYTLANDLDMFIRRMYFFDITRLDQMIGLANKRLTSPLSGKSSAEF